MRGLGWTRTVLLSALVGAALGCPRGGSSAAGSSGATQTGSDKRVIFFGSGHRAAGGVLQGWDPGSRPPPGASEEASPHLPPSPFHWGRATARVPAFGGGRARPGGRAAGRAG